MMLIIGVVDCIQNVITSKICIEYNIDTKCALVNSNKSIMNDLMFYVWTYNKKFSLDFRTILTDNSISSSLTQYHTIGVRKSLLINW